MKTLKVKRLNKSAKLPKKERNEDSGFDIYANESVKIYPGETKVIKTGLAFDIPYGFEIQVRPRSGISSKTDLFVVEGTVDQPYKGEVGVIVKNLSTNYSEIGDYGVNNISGEPERYDITTYHILKGDKIAQIVLCPVEYPELIEVDDIGKSDRGSNGFGSTGV